MKTQSKIVKASKLSLFLNNLTSYGNPIVHVGKPNLYGNVKVTFGVPI